MTESKSPIHPDPAHKEAHEKYRLAGLGLMTTVTTLSSGGLFALNKEIPGWALLLLFVPIALSLLQQMEQYRGGLNEARAETLRAAIEHPNIKATIGEEAVRGLIFSFKDTTEKANVHYGRADNLCIATVVIFIIMGFSCLARLAFWPTTNVP